MHRDLTIESKPCHLTRMPGTSRSSGQSVPWGEHLQNVSARGAAILILCTAALKLLDLQVSGDNSYWNEPDFVLLILTNAQLTFLAATFEIGVAFIVWFCHRPQLRGAVLVWSCAILIVYRVGRLLTHASLPCSCLGPLGRWLHLRPATLDIATWSIIAVLLIIGIAGLILPGGRRHCRVTGEDTMQTAANQVFSSGAEH